MLANETFAFETSSAIYSVSNTYARNALSLRTPIFNPALPPASSPGLPCLFAVFRFLVFGSCFFRKQQQLHRNNNPSNLPTRTPLKGRFRCATCLGLFHTEYVLTCYRTYTCMYVPRWRYWNRWFSSDATKASPTSLVSATTNDSYTRLVLRNPKAAASTSGYGGSKVGGGESARGGSFVYVAVPGALGTDEAHAITVALRGAPPSFAVSTEDRKLAANNRSIGFRSRFSDEVPGDVLFFLPLGCMRSTSVRWLYGYLLFPASPEPRLAVVVVVVVVERPQAF